MVQNDAWVPFSKESEERRNDVELKAKVAKVVRARQAALQEASALLKKATEILEAHSQFAGDAIYARQVGSVSSTSWSLARDTFFQLGHERSSGNPAENDTHLGNLAAGPLGVQIQKMGDEFPL